VIELDAELHRTNKTLQESRHANTLLRGKTDGV